MRERGLPSLNQARTERRRALVYGKVALRAMPPHFWLWVLVAGAAFGVIYWRVAEGRLEARKSAVMAKQRAIAAALGPKTQPFREQVEGWVRELAADGVPDFVAPGDSLKDLREAPGVYLRLRLENAKSRKQIRKAAQDRKSTRLNSSHANISYAVFCLKKKKNTNEVLFYIEKKKQNTLHYG